MVAMTELARSELSIAWSMPRISERRRSETIRPAGSSAPRLIRSPVESRCSLTERFSFVRPRLFRAIIEGIAFGSELILETMRGRGFEPREIVIAGGATRSDLWLQIHADVSKVPLKLTKVPDAPSLGSAILAAVAAGQFPDIAAAAEAMVSVERVVEPNPHTHEAYRPYYEAYKRAYPALAGIARPQGDG